MGWRTGEREGDVPMQPIPSGDGIPTFCVIILLLCVIGACFICVASVGG